MATGTIPKQKMIQRGNTGAVSVNSGSYATKDIVFDVAVPDNLYSVFLTMNSNQTAGGYGQCFISYFSRGTTGFSMRLFNGSSASRTFNVDWCVMEV